MSGNYSYTENPSFRTTDFQSNSKAAANAMRALQLKVKSLETDRDNLQNHINYLLTLHEKPVSGRTSPYSSKEYSDNLDYMTAKIHKLNDAYSFQQQKADFLDKELKRKEQQFLLDRDTWELEITALKKELIKSRGRVMSPKVKNIKKSSKSPKSPKSPKSIEKKPKNIEKPLKNIEKKSKSPKSTKNSEGYERVPELLKQIEKITVDLKKSESEKNILEETVRKLHIEYGENLRVLQEELENIRKTSNHPYVESQKNPLPSYPLRLDSSNDLLELKKELDYYKTLAQSQKSHINELIFEVENLKFDLRKFNNITLYIGKDLKNSENKNVENLQDDAQKLEEKVNSLSKKYKGLLEKTSDTNENTPELREELKKTALELETESCNLYSLRKNRRESVKEKFQEGV
ncbi:hypothetical protein SteCoe_29516 [Stentor coeruleus]|uniref:Uncharacterized protein n=1 Tax=Stentor coeruleus TaxID=5963 RepID=A0A1R2B653_9CILI|nr:hypothetical protein SteCoe_29516 [Stentor coeruleus]